MNIKVRIKNVWFWIGLVGVILSAMGIEPQIFTSWDIVKEQFLSLIKNPYMLGSVFIAVLGVFVDPTTKGVGDSKQALTYTRPKE